jgi:V8-like Glu-specific endopeptidase
MAKLRNLVCIAGSCLALLNACSPTTNNKASVQSEYSSEGFQLGLAQSRIVNGEPVADEDPVAKSTVALYLADKEQTGSVRNICTGTLIAKNIVISAAHCFKDVAELFLKIPLDELIQRMRIGFGTQIVKSESDSRVTFIKIKKVILHPDYVSNMVKQAKRIPMPDLSLIQLESDAPDSAIPTLLGLNMSNIIQKGTPLTLAGYGLTSGEEQTQAKQLMKVDVNIYNPALTSAQFSYNVVDEKTACMGDSGGPAYYKTDKGSMVVVGVTSWGDNTCTSIGVYTNIPAFSDFISSTIAKFN